MIGDSDSQKQLQSKAFPQRHSSENAAFSPHSTKTHSRRVVERWLCAVAALIPSPTILKIFH
jgi:hypothetical protein